MMILIAAALAAAAPAPSADAHARHRVEQNKMDCCKDMKAECKECCEHMLKHSTGSSEDAEHQQ
jgi:hypothetical protein